MVLTGDSLLVGDVGRPDFGGGDAAAQYESLSRLLRLPDWVAVFPGHFEGPCGKGMCGRPSTTIGFERLFNPLARMERAPFIDQLTEAVPARPLNITAIEATNRGLADRPWAMLTSNPAVERISLEELAARAPDKILRAAIDPAAGMTAFYARELAFGLGLTGGQVRALGDFASALYRAFTELDASLVEIHPLVVTGGGEAQIDRTDNTVAGVVNTVQIQNLPLNGRNFLDLAQLQPGVEKVEGGSFDPTKANYTGVSVAGQAGRSAQIAVDGGSINT